MNLSLSTLYEEIGPELLKQLVQEFYNRVYEHPELSGLFQNDKSEVMDKQYCFLTQFLGGPPLYTNTYGPPRMRRRHMPHAITERSKDQWLVCMKDAIDALEIPKDLKNRLYGAFPALASHMVNR